MLGAVVEANVQGASKKRLVVQGSRAGATEEHRLGEIQGYEEIAGARTIARPLELSRERISEHVWRVTMDDGSVQEEVGVAGMVLAPMKKAKR